jgi:hypothetical protein
LRPWRPPYGERGSKPDFRIKQNLRSAR